MSSTGGSIILEWIRQYENNLGVGAHCISDSGALCFLMRDPIALRTYRLIRIGEPSDEGPQEARRAGFTLESIQRAECTSDGDAAYILTESDVYYVRQEGSVVRRSSLQARKGDMFLDLRMAGADAKRSAVVLTQDRSSTSFTVTLLEALDGVRAVWSKTWGDAVLSIAISVDGAFLAVGHQNGNVTLLNRQKRLTWAYASIDESPVIALAVDRLGNVTTMDTAGVMRRHESVDGSVTWRLPTPVNIDPPRRLIRPAILSCDSETSIVLCAVNRLDPSGHAIGTYFFVNGQTGEAIWEDKLASGITGIAVSSSSSYGAVSSLNGETILLALGSSGGTASSLRSSRGSAPELLAQAHRAYNNHNFAKAVGLLTQVFEQDASLYGSGNLYDDASWHLREGVLIDTKDVSAQSLAKADAALELLPHDERLTVRRNALARLLAEQIGKEATDCIAEGRLEDAIKKYTEALSIERSQTELRNALRTACDQLALNLIKDADAAFHEERYEEAIEMLERVLEVRPGEPEILRRLEQAKGLRAFATAMGHYVHKRYSEAGFWFRKSLSVLPDHAEAARYLTFSDNFAKQQSASSAVGVGKSDAAKLNDRFGMLE